MHLAGLQVASSPSATTSTRGPSIGCSTASPAQHDARDRERHLEMAQVVGRVEAVERAFAELVQIEVVPLLRVVVRRRGRTRRGPASRRRRSPRRRRARAARRRRRPGRARRHGRRDSRPAMPRCATRHAGRVGDDRLLEADLRAVGEARHHVRVLAPLRREAGLRRRVAVGILQALDVAADERRQADRPRTKR